GPDGRRVVDVCDRGRPQQVATIDIVEGWHSHKVRVSNGIMLVNHEKIGQSGAADFGGGLGIYDVSQPSNPKPITKWRTAGRGVHRYDFDGRYAYLSPTVEGYVGNIIMILGLVDPARPIQVGRWVDPGSVEGRRRTLSLGQLARAALSSSTAYGQSPLRQLLASRALHPGYFRHVATESGGAYQHQPSVCAPDAYLSADSAPAQGPPHHGGGGRGRRQAAAVGALLRLDLRHHARAIAGADRNIPGARARP